MNVLAAQIEKEKKSKKAYSKLNDSFLLRYCFQSLRRKIKNSMKKLIYLCNTLQLLNKENKHIILIIEELK